MCHAPFEYCSFTLVMFRVEVTRTDEKRFSTETCGMLCAVRSVIPS